MANFSLFLSRNAAPAFALAGGSLALELLAPGMVSRWFPPPLFLTVPVVVGFAGLLARGASSAALPPAFRLALSVVAGVFVAVLASSAAAPGARFLLLFLLATIGIAVSLTGRANSYD